MPSRIVYSATIALLVLSACADETRWFEQRCMRAGLQQGTAEFDACVRRDLQWLEHEQQRRGKDQGR